NRTCRRLGRRDNFALARVVDVLVPLVVVMAGTIALSRRITPSFRGESHPRSWDRVGPAGSSIAFARAHRGGGLRGMVAGVRRFKRLESGKRCGLGSGAVGFVLRTADFAGDPFDRATVGRPKDISGAK